MSDFIIFFDFWLILLCLLGFLQCFIEKILKLKFNFSKMFLQNLVISHFLQAKNESINFNPDIIITTMVK